MNRESSCPGEEKLRDFANGRLENAAALAIQQHLAACANCRQFLQPYQPGRESDGQLPPLGIGSDLPSGGGSKLPDSVSPPVATTATRDLGPADDRETEGLPHDSTDDTTDHPLEELSFLQLSSNPEAIGRLGN